MADWHQCRQCKTWYPPHLETAAFPETTRQRPSCLGCVRAADKDYRIRNKWLKKARAIIRNHAVSLGIAREELIYSYGWDADEIARAAEAAYSQPCPYCGEPYEEEGDLTLDIMHVEQSPYWGVNTQWMCGYDNRVKYGKGAVEFARQMQVMEIFSGEKTFLPPANVLPQAATEELRLFD